MKLRIVLKSVLFALVVAGCSGERQLFSPVDVDRLVVYTMLYVDQRFPEVVLYRTQPPEQTFDLLDASERGAAVTIQYGSVMVYYQETWMAGRYRYSFSIPSVPDVVLPETTYRLQVQTQSGEELSATTTTPPRLSVSDWVLLDDGGVAVDRRLKTFAELGDSVYSTPENQLVYSEGLLEAWVNPVKTAAYQAGIYSLDLFSDFVIDPEFLDEDDFAEFERNIASPPILPSETAIRLPWFAIYFEGRYKIKIFAVDANWYDLARTVPDLGGGGGAFGGNAGDDFARPTFNVDGGIGIFGSASMDSVGFYVHPRP